MSDESKEALELRYQELQRWFDEALCLLIIGGMNMDDYNERKLRLLRKWRPAEAERRWNRMADYEKERMQRFEARIEKAAEEYRLYKETLATTIVPK